MVRWLVECQLFGAQIYSRPLPCSAEQGADPCKLQFPAPLPTGFQLGTAKRKVGDREAKIFPPVPVPCLSSTAEPPLYIGSCCSPHFWLPLGHHDATSSRCFSHRSDNGFVRLLFSWFPHLPVFFFSFSDIFGMRFPQKIPSVERHSVSSIFLNRSLLIEM